jgi:hypothetical protein
VNKRTITALQAWQALGADPAFKPQSEHAEKLAASGKQLWRLNLQGLLAVSAPGSPGEAPAAEDADEPDAWPR